jgi:hypothetical protein
MRIRTLAVSLSAALALPGGAMMAVAAEPPVEEAPAPAIEFSQLYKDPAGDATGFVLEDVLPVSEDTLDLTEGEIGFDHETETVIFRLGVLDLSELPPTGALGKTFYVNFTWGPRAYFVVATDHVVEGQSFGLGSFDDTGFRSGLPGATVTGAFLYDEDVIQIELSADELQNAVAEAPRFAPGLRISTTDVLAQRYIGSDLAGGATPTADTANGRAFTIPQPPEAPEDLEDAEDPEDPED